MFVVVVVCWQWTCPRVVSCYSRSSRGVATRFPPLSKIKLFCFLLFHFFAPCFLFVFLFLFSDLPERQVPCETANSSANKNVLRPALLNLLTQGYSRSPPLSKIKLFFFTILFLLTVFDFLFLFSDLPERTVPWWDCKQALSAIAKALSAIAKAKLRAPVPMVKAGWTTDGPVTENLSHARLSWFQSWLGRPLREWERHGTSTNAAHPPANARRASAPVQMARVDVTAGLVVARFSLAQPDNLPRWLVLVRP